MVMGNVEEEQEHNRKWFRAQTCQMSMFTWCKYGEQLGCVSAEAAANWWNTCPGIVLLVPVYDLI